MNRGLQSTDLLPQGNVFTPVCHSVHRVSVSGPGGSATSLRADTPQGRKPLGRPPRQTPPGQTPPAQSMLGYGQQAIGTHPTGMHSCCS